MTTANQFLVLTAAISINLLALAAMHNSMVESRSRQLLAQDQPERVVITAPGLSRHTLATENCPAPKG